MKNTTSYDNVLFEPHKLDNQFKTQAEEIGSSPALP